MTRPRKLVIRTAVVGGALAGILHCSSLESTFKEPNVRPCDTVYKEKCGAACTSDDTCPDGLYCGGAGTCTADCAPTIPCEGAVACSARGRCEAGGFGEGGLRDGATGDACIDLTVDLAKVEPTVMLLIDQSSSMEAAFGGGGSRWNVVRDVLMNPDGGVVKALEGDVSFGLSLYTRIGSAPQTPAQCPRLLTVMPSLGNHSKLASLYYDAGPAGGTPTGQSIDKLIGRVNGQIQDGGFATLPTKGPKIIVLATDGEPDSCQNNDDPQGRAMTVAATQAAFAAGIRTFAIAVGDQIGTDHLREVANAGAGMKPDAGDAAPFTTTNRADFVAAINAIVFGVRSCVFTLGGQVQNGSEPSGSVVLDAEPLGYLDPNGWRLNSPSELELTGSACQKLKSGGGKLSVRFPCGAFLPR